MGWVFPHDNVEMALSHTERLEVLAYLHRLRNRDGFKRVGRLPALLDIQMGLGTCHGDWLSRVLELRSVHAFHSDKPVLDFGREKAVRGDKGKEKKRMKTHKK